MKKSLIVLVLTAISGFALAQDLTKKFSVQLELGPSIPLGRFAHKSLQSSPHDSSGNAITGIAANIALQYELVSNFGVSLLIGASINGQDKQYLKKQVKGEAEGSITSFTAKNWNAYKLMPGIYYSIPLSSTSKFAFKSMLSAGICKTAVPALSYSFTGTTPTLYSFSASRSKENLPISFCYRVSAELDYALSKKIYLLFNANYFTANPTLKYSYFPNWPQVGNMTEGKKTYSLASINMQIGAGVRF